jgi:hypothetical protein
MQDGPVCRLMNFKLLNFIVLSVIRKQVEP